MRIRLHMSQIQRRSYILAMITAVSTTWLGYLCAMRGIIDTWCIITISLPLAGFALWMLITGLRIRPERYVD